MFLKSGHTQHGIAIKITPDTLSSRMHTYLGKNTEHLEKPKHYLSERVPTHCCYKSLRCCFIPRDAKSTQKGTRPWSSLWVADGPAEQHCSSQSFQPPLAQHSGCTPSPVCNLQFEIHLVVGLPHTLPLKHYCEIFLNCFQLYYSDCNSFPTAGADTEVCTHGL